MLKVGIIGLGHLGEIHLKQWLEIVSPQQIFCFDNNTDRLDTIAAKYQVAKLSSFEELLAHSDIIDVVTPTNFHFVYAAAALKANKHVFIEKPVCESVEEVEELIALQNQSQTLVQIGHVERFNPAYLKVEHQITSPKFFEVHRLAPFIQRGTEVSVIMDLMIHDLDIILHLVKSEIKHISAKGVAILSTSPDIANVRIEFENGCVANLTASRISMKKMRKMRIFSDKGYTSIDFLEKKAEMIEIMNKEDGRDGILFKTSGNIEKKLLSNSYTKLDGNAIFEELHSFYEAVNSRKKDTAIDLISASKTLSLAIHIQEMINTKENIS